MLRYPTERTITEVPQPVLVVRGTRDPIARHDWSARVAAAAPNGTFVELDGPHHVQERQPDAFARLLESFRSAERLEGLR